MTQVTENFTLEELCHSNTAKSKGMKNTPGTAELINLYKLAENLLQPLRNLYKEAMIVSSGYRSPKVNQMVGGVVNSQHLKGQAADISCENPRNLLKLLQKSGLIFDQAILYDDGRNYFLHLSYVEGKNRNQVLYSKGTRP